MSEVTPEPTRRYVLKRFVLSREPSIELTHTEYDGIIEAQRRAVEASTLEDAFDAMLGNYEEFERELLAIALSAGMRENASYESSAALDTLSVAGRHLANILASATTYRTQAERTISRWYGGTESVQVEALKRSLSQEYDAELGYRVCYHLRNHVQHGGTAVHGASTSPREVMGSDGRRACIVRTFAPEIGVEQLREGGKFRPSILAELEHGGRVAVDGRRMHDVRPFVRAFVSALGRVHVRTRELMRPEVATSDSVIVATISRYLALPGARSDLGLTVMEVNERGHREGRPPVWVLMRPIERRQAFTKRNDCPVYFAREAVSNEAAVLSRSAP